MRLTKRLTREKNKVTFALGVLLRDGGRDEQTQRRIHYAENAIRAGLAIPNTLLAFKGYRDRRFKIGNIVTGADNRIMTTGFDVSQFQKEMSRVFKDYRALNKRALPYLLRNRAIQLAVGSGKRGKYKGLYQEALRLRPMVQEEIRALPAKLNYRIKRSSPGRTVKQEIQARLVHAGRFQASGWIVPGLSDISGEGSNVRTVRGKVSMQMGGKNPSITLTNTSPRALEYGTRTGYIARAFYNQTQDMLKYIQDHLDLTAAEFYKKYPNFRQPIEHFMP